MSTDTDTNKVPSTDALMEYAKVAEEFQAAKAKYDEAMEAVEPVKAEFEAVRDKVSTYVDAMGSDPLGLLGKAGKRGRKSGPRDPNRRKDVLRVLKDGATARQVVDALNEDAGYVNGVINQAKKAGDITQEGQRPNTTYTFTGDIEDD